MIDIKIKNCRILLLSYFLTTATATILISLLSVALTVFAGTVYIGGDLGELIKNLADVGITEDTILLIVQIARVWILLAPLGAFVFSVAELYHYLCEKRKTEIDIESEDECD